MSENVAIVVENRVKRTVTEVALNTSVLLNLALAVFHTTPRNSAWGSVWKRRNRIG